MTVYLSLVILLIDALLFTMLESARVYGLRAYADMNSTLSLESLFAEYDGDMYERYHLLFLDTGYGSSVSNYGKIQDRILMLNQTNLKPNGKKLLGQYCNLYAMDITQCVVEKSEFATDYGGKAFKEQAVTLMEKNIPYLVAEKMYESILDAKEIEQVAGEPEQNLGMGQSALEVAKNERHRLEEEKKTNPNVQIPPPAEVEDPIAFASNLKSKGILALVLEHPQELSVKAIDLEQTLWNREKNQGNYTDVYENNAAKDILFQMYLTKYFASYTNPLEEGVLDYELEYMLAGKESDQENLENVVYRLIAVREGANYIYLLRDPKKCEEAMAVATAFAGFTGNPAIVEAVKMGVLAAWAFVESIADVRCLLSGGSIALMKTSEDWCTDIFHISQSFESCTGDRKNVDGLNYGEYLQRLLYFAKGTKLNYRALDLVEKNLQMSSNNPMLCIDNYAQKMQIAYEYQARPLFFSFVTIGNVSKDSHQFTTQKVFSCVQ